MTCHRCGHNQDHPSLFCAECGKLLNREGLLSVGFKPFTGAQSINPGVERSWWTGEPPG